MYPKNRIGLIHVNNALPRKLVVASGGSDWYSGNNRDRFPCISRSRRGMIEHTRVSSSGLS